MSALDFERLVGTPGGLRAGAEVIAQEAGTVMEETAPMVVDTNDPELTLKASSVELTMTLEGLVLFLETSAVRSTL